MPGLLVIDLLADTPGKTLERSDFPCLPHYRRTEALSPLGFADGKVGTFQFGPAIKVADL